MRTSTMPPPLALAAEPPRHDHDGRCSGRLTFGADGRLMLSVVCDDCGETVTVLGSLDHQLNPKLGPALDLAA